MAYDNDYEREMLIDELERRPRPRNGNTGITGIGLDPTVPVPVVEAPAESPAPRQTYAMGGFDAGKLADPTHNTEKYQIGRVMQYHDPKKGITAELLADLNALDIGDFSGQGDKLTIANPRNGNRLAAGTGDVSVNFTGDGPANWTYLDTSSGAPVGSAPYGMGAGYGPSSFGSIQSLVPTDMSFYNALQQKLAEIVGGSEALDREALLKLLGA